MIRFENTQNTMFCYQHCRKSVGGLPNSNNDWRISNDTNEATKKMFYSLNVIF